jgi:hypothetical protein
MAHIGEENKQVKSKMLKVIWEGGGRGDRETRRKALRDVRPAPSTMQLVPEQRGRLAGQTGRFMALNYWRAERGGGRVSIKDFLGGLPQDCLCLGRGFDQSLFVQGSYIHENVC